jgi:hypothetical protein
MHGDLRRPTQGLAELVAGHEQALAIARTGLVKFGLPGIGPIATEAGADEAALKRLRQAFAVPEGAGERR